MNMKQEQLPDYATVAEALAACHAVCDPAEAHGLLSGMLCARADMSVAAWLDELGAVCEGTPGARVLHALYEVSSAALREGDFSFTPLLEDDSRMLADRLEAFRDWCEGFYLGLTVGGVTDIEKLPPDSREFLADLVEFAQLETGENETAGEAGCETGGQAGEQNGTDSDDGLERDFMELNEYLRVGVMLVREELGNR